MALSATFITSSPSSSSLYTKFRKPFFSHSVYLLKPLKIRASTTLDYSNVSSSNKSSPLKVRITILSNIYLLVLFPLIAYKLLSFYLIFFFLKASVFYLIIYDLELDAHLIMKQTF